MSTSKTIKRLVACFGSIQLVTVLSVLSYREKLQQELNLKYENYLVITPLFAPQGQNEEFAAFIEKIAKVTGSWERIIYIPLEEIKSITQKISYLDLSEISNMIHKIVGIESPDELYLSRAWDLENQLLINVYESAEKICYGDGIGIYFSHSAFLPPSSFKNPYGYLSHIYNLLKKKIRVLLPKKKLFKYQDFDLGYFSLPYAFGEVPPMNIVILDRDVYLETFQSLREDLITLMNNSYIDKLRKSVQNAPVSILISSNFSESGRMSLENEIAAYREYINIQGIPKNSILLIKPHPRDSKLKMLKLKSVLSDLYADIILLSEDFLFYLPFEILFMELFLNPDITKPQSPKLFTFSSACLTLEFLFNAECIVGFGNVLVRRLFYKDQVSSRIKHEEDLLSTIQDIRGLNAA